MVDTEQPSMNDDPFQNRKKLDTSSVLDEIGRKNHAAPRRSNTAGRTASAFMFVLILLLAAATGWLGYQQWLSQDRVTRAVTDVQSESARWQQQVNDMRAELTAQREQLQSDMTEQAALLRQSNSAVQTALTEIDTQEQSGQQRLERVQQQVARDMSDTQSLVAALQRQVAILQQRDTRWLNAEANYLMRLAQQKLQLESDLASAELLLGMIDTLLAGQSGPLVATTRQNLADDLQAIRNTQLPDRAMVSQRLVRLGNNLDQMSLAGSRQDSYQEGVQGQLQETAQAVSEVGWVEAGLDLLRSIFVWREWDETPAESLPLQQEDLLKQQLQLQLEQAQLAMLQDDESLYRQILAQVSNNIQRYVGSDNERGRQLLAELEQLQAIEIHMALPDLSDTAALIRQLASSAAPATPVAPATPRVPENTSGPDSSSVPAVNGQPLN